jgi:hypothetical protein
MELLRTLLICLAIGSVLYVLIVAAVTWVFYLQGEQTAFTYVEDRRKEIKIIPKDWRHWLDWEHTEELYKIWRDEAYPLYVRDYAYALLNEDISHGEDD